MGTLLRFMRLIGSREQAQALVDLGGQYAAAGSYVSAIRCGLLARASDPTLAESYLLLASAYRRLDRPGRAREYFGRGAALAPADARFAIGLGALECELGQDAAAEVAFARARELAPEDADLLVRLGESRWRQGDFTGAEEPLRAAARLAPKTAPAAYHLAVALTGQVRYHEALEATESAVALEPGNAAFRDLRDNLRESVAVRSEPA